MKPLRDFDEVRRAATQRTQQTGPLTLALACAEDPYALQALRGSADQGMIRAILVGHEIKIQEVAAQSGVKLSGFQIINEERPQSAVVEAAHLVASGQADLLMKGKIMAYEFLEAALHDSVGLRRDHQIWTHVGIFWPELLSRFIIVTDGGVLIDPTIEQVPAMISNAAEVARLLGLMKPRVALLAAVETVYPNMPVAITSAAVAKMAERGQIENVLVDGPLSLDVAISPEAAHEKNVGGEVAGRADILLTNKIEVGNALCKSIFIFGRARSAGLVIGPKQPIILTSRSESADAKVNSIALAVLMAKK